MYHPSIYDDTQPVPSYWEATDTRGGNGYQPLLSDAACDVAVIGGGYTGLSAALHLARDYDIDVRVLEAGHIGWGASGRNGGFCCLPASRLSIQQLIKRYGLDATKRFFATQLEGMDLVASLAADENIDLDRQGDGNFTVAHHPSRFQALQEEAQALSSLFGIKTRVLTRSEFIEVGHDSTEQYGAMHMAAGFALNPLKFLKGLAAATARRGARLHPHSRVLEWVHAGGVHRLVTREATLTAHRVIVATNGFTREGLHQAFDKMMLPVLSNIITTRPLTDEELERQKWNTSTPICNTRNLLFYYRMLPDRSFMFGTRGDTTGHPKDGARMRDWMIRRLAEVFPGWRDVPITHFWRGLVCMTRKLTPSVGQLDDDASVWYGFGYQANGVNTAPWAGMMLARHIAEPNKYVEPFPSVIHGLAPKFPFAAIRRWALRAAYTYYRIQDAR
ncbi:MAG: NAD(P)/FAD-dependent oxidoreductase [Acidiferrobacterales bacterium]